MSKFVYCKMHHYEYRLEPSSHARLWEPREGGPFLPIRSVLKNTTRGALIFMFRVKNTSGVLSSSSLTPPPAGRCRGPAVLLGSAPFPVPLLSGPDTTSCLSLLQQQLLGPLMSGSPSPHTPSSDGHPRLPCPPQPAVAPSRLD